MICPITGKDCARRCSEQIFCQLLELRREQPSTELAVTFNYFIQEHRLGGLEQVVTILLANRNKRGRRVTLNAVQHTLKTLGLIPHSVKVIALGMGCLDIGDRGLFVLCTSPIHVQGDIPSAKT